MRKSKNWTQEEMAEKLNMCVNAYAKIERGETKSYNPKLEQIAELFGLDLLELISSQDKNVYLGNGDDNHSCNVIGASNEIAFEIQKLQMTIQHKDEIINHKDEIIDFQKREIARLGEMLELIKSK